LAAVVVGVVGVAADPRVRLQLPRVPSLDRHQSQVIIRVAAVATGLLAFSMPQFAWVLLA